MTRPKLAVMPYQNLEQHDMRTDVFHQPVLVLCYFMLLRAEAILIASCAPASVGIPSTLLAFVMQDLLGQVKFGERMASAALRLAEILSRQALTMPELLDRAGELRSLGL